MAGWIVVVVISVLIGIRLGGRMMANAIGRAEARGTLRRARGASRIPWW